MEKVKKIVDTISALNVQELVWLEQELRKFFGVSETIMMESGNSSGAQKAQEEEQVAKTYNLILKKASKELQIKVISFLRKAYNLQLLEAKNKAIEAEAGDVLLESGLPPVNGTTPESVSFKKKYDEMQELAKTAGLFLELKEV